MQLIKPYFEIIGFPDRNCLKLIEKIGRVCWKSEDKITDNSHTKFCSMLMNKNHLSVIEHAIATVKFVVDRGLSHELVRHRLCSFTQESTRYAKNKNGLIFVIPPWVNIKPGFYNSDLPFGYLERFDSLWYNQCFEAEIRYINLVINGGWSPEQARTILPNSLKTELYVTTNLREWKHIFNLRCDKSAHPQMKEIMIPLEEHFCTILPEIFGKVA